MFRSFYLAGFECATGYNMHGEWIDQIAATQHDRHVNEDYARLAEVDIHAVREAIRWPLVDKGGGRYDFSSVEKFVSAALRYRCDVIWDLFHYGYPDGVDPFSSEFVERFAAYCRAAAAYVSTRMQGPHFFTPINEPSFFSWAGGESARFAPHQRGRAIELKINLARATLRAIDAIREVCPTARIVNIDPICHVVPLSDAQHDIDAAREFNQHTVYQFWDLVCGRELPELGGRPDYLDIIGMNYYWTNEWVLGREGTPLTDDDPRRVPLADLVRDVWKRYGTDIVITETSALEEARGPWVHELSAMAEELLEDGVALRGICLYPILGMPEWHAREEWTRMGLWDLDDQQERLERKICAPMLEALRAAQRRSATCDIGRAETFVLPRTGSVPLTVQGALVANRAGHGYQIRLVRSDHPHRLWVASVDVLANGGWVSHVLTSAQLPLLLNELRASGPAALARHHGSEANDDSSWIDAIEHLAADRERLEKLPLARAVELLCPESVGGRM
jgi:beta-glucosidase/6-phospho-beta-glucosidase/beta-galactosidase